jgi:hypothetical protein
VKTTYDSGVDAAYTHRVADMPFAEGKTAWTGWTVLTGMTISGDLGLGGQRFDIESLGVARFLEPEALADFSTNAVDAPRCGG